MATKLFRNSSHWGAFLAEVEEGRVTAVQPFEEDPHPSPMLDAIPHSVHTETRVMRPFVREGWLKNGPGNGEGRGREPFVPVSWEKAFDLVAGEMKRVKDTYTNDAIMGGSYGWSSAGTFHHARIQLRRFLFSFGGCVDQSSNYSFGAALAFVPHIAGDMRTVTGPITSWAAVAKHTKNLLVFGGINPKNNQAARGGNVAHEFMPSMKKIAAAGVNVVNVSPCRDDAAEFLNPTWLAIRPNTDTAMMLALSHTLITENLHDPDFLEKYCEGADRVLPYVMGESDGVPKDAEWAAAITEIDADTIRSLARQIASGRTMMSATWSLQRADHGEQPYWALILLACTLGHIGLPGGGFTFGYGSTGGLGNEPPLFNPPSLSAGRNPTNYAIPAARITDALLNPGDVIEYNGKKITYPDIKMIYWAGGNPFHHHQDLNRLRLGWQRPDTVIVHEPWWTATARHADIVLPATTTLERNDFGSAARDPYLVVMEKAVEPVGESKNDFDILRELASRLGCEEAFTEGRDEKDWLRFLYDSCREGAKTANAAMPEFDEFWENGFYRIPDREENYTLFSDFRDDPEANRLKTRSGKFELYSKKIEKFNYDDCPPHVTWFEPAEWLGSEKTAQFPLHLMSSQPKDRLHSQMDDGPVSGATKVAGREPVEINPIDAAARGIDAGDLVRVFNDRGACLAGAVINDDIRPSVIRLSAGAWYDNNGGASGALEIHGNPNVLTRDKGTSQVGQSPSSTTALVDIEKFEGDAPEINVSRPPEIVSI
ncbi:MAG: Asp-tRNA(Asn)/Glu-tRNA(Gln) amidotransferase GatCAB subunit C [Rhodospirillaceae bacterium]|nr:Asp-tRNA(Asn)/Glu-tRNA(Gln) amidotransferase GatCAB subunit C [Rhodospirillaceae bacterium]|tara:strand:+ start:6205 stop:8511 length:2307 start_codon:yes stop_codon:yes gene_type:complete